KERRVFIERNLRAIREEVALENCLHDVGFGSLEPARGPASCGLVVRAGGRLSQGFSTPTASPRPNLPPADLGHPEARERAKVLEDLLSNRLLTSGVLAVHRSSNETGTGPLARTSSTARCPLHARGQGGARQSRPCS